MFGRAHGTCQFDFPTISCTANFWLIYVLDKIQADDPLAIWVEVQSIVGLLRLRLQLTPDPPFVVRCTISFMGKPKASLSCTPLFKHGLNIMHLPIISSFVQTSVDAAMANYVAPKSLTLDIKDIFKADDSKKDTSAYGVVVVHISRATGFKKGYTDFLGLKKDSSDPYVSVGWAKFGKSVWSTRVIVSEMEPIWDETGFILIGPVELNAQERLSEISITLQLCVRGLTVLWQGCSYGTPLSRQLTVISGL
jgi:Ca2+-dependent lipid-binding protein